MRALPRASQLARNVLSLGAGTAVGQGLVVLASPIWSRIYDSADFGRFGLFLSFLSTATVAVALRYDLAIPLGKDREEMTLLLLLCFLAIGPMSLLLGATFVVLCHFGWLGFSELPIWSGVIAVPLLATAGIFTALRFWHVGVGQFSAIGRSLIFQGSGRAVVPLLLGPLHLGWIGLAAGEAVGRFLGIRRLAADAIEPLRSAMHGRPILAVRALARAYQRFPLVFLPSAIVDAFSSSLALPVFVLLHGVSAGGQFLLAQQIIVPPAALLCAALADVYHRHLVASARENEQLLASAVSRLAIRLLLIAGVIFVPISLVAPFLARPIFGPGWEQSGLFVAWLAPAAVIGVAASTLSRALVVSRVPQLKFIADVLKLVLPIGGMIVSAGLGGSSTSVVATYSILLGVSYVAYLLIIMYAVRPSRQVNGR